jgi:hypothetical protein
MGCSFLVVLAGGSLRTPPATLLASSRLAVRLRVAGTLGGALLGVDAIDGGAGPLPGSPLGWIMEFGAEGPVGVGDVVGAPVVFDVGRGLAPGSPAPGRLGHGPQGVQDIAGPVGLERRAGRPPLPGQGPHHLPILGAEIGVGL